MQNIRWKPSPSGSLLIRYSFMRLGLLARPRSPCVSPAGFMAFFVWHARVGMLDVCALAMPQPGTFVACLPSA